MNLLIYIKIQHNISIFVKNIIENKIDKNNYQRT